MLNLSSYNYQNRLSFTSGSKVTLLDDSVRTVKIKISKEVIDIFKRENLPLRGKKVLDVGTGYAFNAKAMQEAGADVFAVEPDPEAVKIALAEGNLKKDELFQGKVQDLHEEYNGKFDYVTLFLYNIFPNERVEVMQRLAKLIKPSGKAIIGVHDNYYINDSYGKIRPLINEHFLLSKKLDMNAIGNTRVYIAKSYNFR